MRRTKIIPIRLVQANHDTDWDGVPNRLDCQPLNPRKQDVDTSQGGDMSFNEANRYLKEAIKIGYGPGPMHGHGHAPGYKRFMRCFRKFQRCMNPHCKEHGPRCH